MSINTSDGTALASDILNGKIAYSQGQRIVGTMPNRGSYNSSLSIDSGSSIPAGYHNGNGKITQNIEALPRTEYIPTTSSQKIAYHQYLAGDQIIKGDSNFIASNIKPGVTIFGVKGNCYLESGGYTSIREQVLINNQNNPNHYYHGGEITLETKTGSYFTPIIWIKMKLSVSSNFTTIIIHQELDSYNPAYTGSGSSYFDPKFWQMKPPFVGNDTATNIDFSPYDEKKLVSGLSARQNILAGFQDNFSGNRRYLKFLTRGFPDTGKYDPVPEGIYISYLSVGFAQK